MEVHFTMIEEAIVKYVAKADKAHVCSAWFSSRPILDALSQIEAELIMTYQRKYVPGHAEFSREECHLLTHNLSGVYLYAPDTLMHNKFIVLFSDEEPEAVLLGSYNFTRTAPSSEECCVYIPEPPVARSFEERFQYLKRRSQRCV